MYDPFKDFQVCIGECESSNNLNNLLKLKYNVLHYNQNEKIIENLKKIVLVTDDPNLEIGTYEDIANDFYLLQRQDYWDENFNELMITNELDKYIMIKPIIENIILNGYLKLYSLNVTELFKAIDLVYGRPLSEKYRTSMEGFGIDFEEGMSFSVSEGCCEELELEGQKIYFNLID